MTPVCPECGAILNEESSCQAIFDSFLVLEFTNPGYGAVHFLTVACFMVQHNRYSDAGLAWIKRMLHAYLDENLTDKQLRRMAAHDAQSSIRTWKVNRQPNEPPLPKIKWDMTITDVAAQYQDAASYCKLVKEWARQTLKQMEYPF